MEIKRIPINIRYTPRGFTFWWGGGACIGLTFLKALIYNWNLPQRSNLNTNPVFAKFYPRFIFKKIMSQVSCFIKAMEPEICKKKFNI